MMDTERHLKATAIGRKNKAIGNLWEQIIEDACKHYSQSGEAEIEKTPEPLRPIKRLSGGQFIAVFTKKAQPDYKGTVAGGKSIVLEAKHTDTGRIKRNVISTEQELRLDKHTALGADCFVLLSFGLERFFKIPWRWFRDMQQRIGRKYITPDDVQKFEIFYISGVLRFL